MLKVAAAQIKISKNTEINFNKIIEYIKKAASKKADIVCFPEASLIHNKNKSIIKKISISQKSKISGNLENSKNFQSKKYLEKIKKQCKENKIYCIFSSYNYKKNNVYNSAFFIDKNGKLLYKYNKVNLFRKEKGKVISGKTNKIIKTEFGNIGIIICWDISFPEFVKQLSKKGAWLIFCPSYTKNYGRELESYLHIPYVRAFENSCCFVSCDSANKECAQYSVICSPSKILNAIKGKEGLIVADLDRRKIVGLRRYYGLV